MNHLLLIKPESAKPYSFQVYYDINLMNYMIYIENEWIELKAGFEQKRLDEYNIGEGYYYQLQIGKQPFDDLCFLSGDKNGKLEVTLFPYEDFYRFEFLHQLQNLSHSLTGVELDMKI